MCKYTLLKKLKSDGTLKAAINTGLISPSVLGHESIYEYYLKVKNRHSKMMAISVVSEDKKVCERTVRRVIKDFGC